MTHTEQQYHYIRDHHYLPCKLLGLEYGCWRSLRTGQLQYYVETNAVPTFPVWRDFTDALYTAFEIEAEELANSVDYGSPELNTLIFWACLKPAHSYALYMMLDSDPVQFTKQQLDMLAAHAYGAATRCRAAKELDRRAEETETRNEEMEINNV